MPTAGSLSSLLGNGIGQLIAFIVGVGAIYKFFIEFVEADEMAVRARNNKIDYYHVRMSWARRIIVSAGVFTLVTGLVLIVKLGFDHWFVWTPIIILALLTIGQALSSWPRTEIPALVGPGFKIKVPGWVSYKRAKAATNTRAVVVAERVDASGCLVNVEVNYVWARGTKRMTELWKARAKIVSLLPTDASAIANAAELLWRSLFGVDNLEESLDGIVQEATLKVIGSTMDMTRLEASAIHPFCGAVAKECELRFQKEFGATLHVIRLGRSGPPAQVIAMEQVADALRSGVFPLKPSDDLPQP